MALTQASSSNFLLYIIGEVRDFGNSENSSYLALSSTKPQYTSEGKLDDETNYTNYNITEPTALSYKRVCIGSTNANVLLNNYFVPADVKIVKKGDEYVDTLGIQQIADSDFSYITNSTEIHFPEALEEWGTFEYFAIYDRATGGTPKYIGALKSPLTVVENSVPLIRKNGLRIISY